MSLGGTCDQACWLAEACKENLLLLLLQVSVGRLGIITQLTLTIVPQQAVRRAEQDMTVAQFAQQVKQVQDAYTQAKQTGSAEAIWAALHSLNETQASSPCSVYSMFWLLACTC